MSAIYPPLSAHTHSPSLHTTLLMVCLQPMRMLTQHNASPESPSQHCSAVCQACCRALCFWPENAAAGCGQAHCIAWRQAASHHSLPCPVRRVSPCDCACDEVSRAFRQALSNEDSAVLHAGATGHIQRPAWPARKVDPGSGMPLRSTEQAMQSCCRWPVAGCTPTGNQI